MNSKSEVEENNAVYYEENINLRLLEMQLELDGL